MFICAFHQETSPLFDKSFLFTCFCIYIYVLQEQQSPTKGASREMKDLQELINNKQQIQQVNTILIINLSLVQKWYLKVQTK